MGLDGVEIFTNSSASHHELRKLHTRIDLILEATQKVRRPSLTNLVRILSIFLYFFSSVVSTFMPISKDATVTDYTTTVQHSSRSTARLSLRGVNSRSTTSKSSLPRWIFKPSVRIGRTVVDECRVFKRKHTVGSLWKVFGLMLVLVMIPEDTRVIIKPSHSIIHPRRKSRRSLCSQR